MEDNAEQRIWRTISTDAVEGARLSRQQVKDDQLSMQARRRQRIVEGYYIGLQLMNDYTEWQRFLADPFFDFDKRIRNKQPDRYKFIVMRAVMIYLFMAGKDNVSLRNRTWRYARAMDGYAEDAVPPEEAAAKIKADGGIEKLCRARSKERNLEDEDKDWRLEMEHREPQPSTERAQARDADSGEEITGEAEPDEDDDADEDEESEDQDQAEELYEEPDPTAGMVMWPVMIEPHERRDLERAAIGGNIRVTICVRRKADGARWFEANMIDFLG